MAFMIHVDKRARGPALPSGSTLDVAKLALWAAAVAAPWMAIILVAAILR
jgi:hypothetical protein